MRHQRQEETETIGTRVGKTIRKGTEIWKTGPQCVQECKGARL